LPLPDSKAETVAKHFVENCVLRFGQPSAVLTDCGRNLTSKIFSECCKLLGIKRMFSTPYRAFQDGTAEHSIGSVKRCLTALVDQSASDWDKWAHFAAHALNTTRSRATGHSPHYLLFGVQPTLGLDFLQAQVIAGPLQLRWRMASAYKAVKQFIQRDVDTRVRKYNINKRERNYSCGDLVYRKKMVITPEANNGLLPK